MQKIPTFLVPPKHNFLAKANLVPIPTTKLVSRFANSNSSDDFANNRVYSLDYSSDRSSFFYSSDLSFYNLLNGDCSSFNSFPTINFSRSFLDLPTIHYSTRRLILSKVPRNGLHNSTMYRSVNLYCRLT